VFCGQSRGENDALAGPAELSQMEIFGILCSIPAAFCASAIYARILRSAILSPRARRLVLWTSVSVLGSLSGEWILLATVGAVRGRQIVGPSFYPVHLIVFFLAIPALVNILVLTRRDSILGSVLGAWIVVGILGAVLALPVVLTQYIVSEALYGVDGHGGPYGEP
jgi:hypothetical protein